MEPDAFNRFEAAGWEQRAATYEDSLGQITTRVVEPLLDAAGVGGGARVLDVASGPGFVSAAAAERGASVVGVDIAEAMLAIARQRYPELEFRHGSAEALPFGDGSVDAVVANFLLLHLGRPEQAAAEFARVLVPGGRLALTVWDVPEEARFLGVFLEAVATAGASPPEDIPVGPPFFRFSDEQEFVQLLRDQGFEGIEVTTIAFSHAAPSPDAWWWGVLNGAVRTPALIFGQTDEMQRQIRTAFDRIVTEQYTVGTELELPVSVKLASGRTPAR